MLTQLVVAILGISFLIGFLAMRLWKKDSPHWKVFIGFYSFFPALISILLIFLRTNQWSIGDFSVTTFDPLYMFLGFLTPVVFLGVNLSVHTMFSSYKFKESIDWKQILTGIPVSILVLIIFVAGEEFGWRGFLQTPLIERFGITAGILLLGAIWGIWHAPVALRGHNLKSDFWAEAFILYPYLCICYSFPLAFLTIKSGSLWPALIFHATNNTIGSFGSLMVEKQNSKLEVLLHMLTGTLLIIIFSILL